MKKTLLVTICLVSFIASCMGQKKRGITSREIGNVLPEIHKCIVELQDSMSLFTQNQGNNLEEHDVNSIILDIEKYIDSLPKTHSRADGLLAKYFAPLRLFYLTTTNKTTVATSFLYSEAPYRFARYNDSALALLIGAIKDGNTYNLGKMTERRAAKVAMETCLLPSLKALDEFKEGELKYVAVSIYYGCRDTREGAVAEPVTPYCMTLLARLTDIQQYNAGLITAKGLLSAGEVYVSNIEDAHELRRVLLSVE